MSGDQFYREVSGGWNAGDAIVVAIDGDGVSVSVTQEMAVDSYNHDFTCSFALSRADAEALRDWLTDRLK